MTSPPLLLVGGPAGAGKSTIRTALLGTIPEVVLMESDLLWRSEYEQDPTAFLRLWLRLASEIAQSGRPVVIFGAGFAVPHEIERLPERSAFSRAHYLAVTCDEDVLAARIRARSAPRRTDDAHVREHADFGRWLRAHARASDPPITLIDSSHATVEEVAGQVASWIRRCLVS